MGKSPGGWSGASWAIPCRVKVPHARAPRSHCSPASERPVAAVSKYFATCARGLEPVLADELRALGAEMVEPGRGGVHFAGDKAALYRANLWLRTAIRVLRPVADFAVTTPEELYDAV